MTPESIVSDAAEGDDVDFEATVHTLTFDSTFSTDGPDGTSWARTPGRFLLVRSEQPPGVTIDDLDKSDIDSAWGLGVRIPEEALTGVLPHIGDRVHVTGRFARIHWSEFDRIPVIEEATVEIVDGASQGAAAGDACANDLDCHDRLICVRATGTCGLPPSPVEWGSAWHDVNGACSTDDDCPLGQRCDTGYTITDAGDYAIEYLRTEDVGRHICVGADGAGLADLCPRVFSAADLAGGRFVTGKEVCIEGTIWLTTVPEDGDTHVQMVVDEPLPYPTAESPYWLFGATTENGPSYKDPAHAGGALADPEKDSRVIAVGTYRYDDDHGWFEVHPVKAYFPADAP